jgi:hypothetical protein
MKSHRVAKYPKSPADRPSPSPLTSHQISGIFEEIEKCYKQIRFPSPRENPLRNKRLQILLFVGVGLFSSWTLAYILVRVFPHNTSVGIGAFALYVLGFVPYAVFVSVDMVRSIRSGWARIERGALDEFAVARKLSETESLFVNALPRFDERVRCFAISELTLLKNELESLPTHIRESFGVLVTIVTLLLAAGYGKLVLPVAKALPPSVLLYLTFIALLVLFLAIVFNGAISSERVLAVKRVIALIRFSLGDFGDDDAVLREAAMSDDIKIETKGDESADDESLGVDDAVEGASPAP